MQCVSYLTVKSQIYWHIFNTENWHVGVSVRSNSTQCTNTVTAVQHATLLYSNLLKLLATPVSAK